MSNKVQASRRESHRNVADFAQTIHLGVFNASLTMESSRDNPVPAHEHRAYRRIRTREAETLPGLRERGPHIFFVGDFSVHESILPAAWLEQARSIGLPDCAATDLAGSNYSRRSPVASKVSVLWANCHY